MRLNEQEREYIHRMATGMDGNETPEQWMEHSRRVDKSASFCFIMIFSILAIGIFSAVIALGKTHSEPIGMAIVLATVFAAIAVPLLFTTK